MEKGLNKIFFAGVITTGLILIIFGLWIVDTSVISMINGGSGTGIFGQVDATQQYHAGLIFALIGAVSISFFSMLSLAGEMRDSRLQS